MILSIIDNFYIIFDVDFKNIADTEIIQIFMNYNKVNWRKLALVIISFTLVEVIDYVIMIFLFSIDWSSYF
jgi:hypothetical protein